LAVGNVELGPSLENWLTMWGNVKGGIGQKVGSAIRNIGSGLTRIGSAIGNIESGPTRIRLAARLGVSQGSPYRWGP